MKKIGFGRGYTAGQWYLPGTPFALLPAPPPGGVPPAGDAIDTTYTAPRSGVVYGGAVAISKTTYAGKAAMLFDVTGAWDSVKNAAYASDVGGAIVLNGFTQADAVITGGSAIVAAIGVKRANIVTDSGNDVIRVETLDNGTPLAGRDIRILSGAGNDTVTIAPADPAARLAAGDITYLPPDGGVFYPSGAGQTAYVDLGAGNDRFIGLGATADQVDGGAGNDSLQAGAGADSLTGGAGRDLFVFGRTDGYDTITDFNPTHDPALSAKATVTFAPGPGLETVPLAGGASIGVLHPGYGSPGLAWQGVFVVDASSALSGYGINSDIAIIGTNTLRLPFPGFDAAAEIRAPYGMDLLQLRVYLGDSSGRLGAGNSLDRDGFTILGMKAGVVVAQRDVGLPVTPGEGQLLKFDASWKGIDEIAFSRLDGLALIDDLVATVTGLPPVIGVMRHIDFTATEGMTEPLATPTGAFHLPEHYGSPDLTWGDGIDLYDMRGGFGRVGLLDGSSGADRSISGHDLSLFGLTLKSQGLDDSITDFFDVPTITVEGLVGGVVVARADLQFDLHPFLNIGSGRYTFDDYSGFRNLDSIRFSGGILADTTQAVGIDDLDLRVAPAARSEGFDKLKLLGLTAAEVQDVIDTAVQNGTDLLLHYGDSALLTLHDVDKAELSIRDFVIA